jgi:alcohol dehydrogenase class IV
LVTDQLLQDEAFNAQVRELLQQVSVKFFDDTQREKLVESLVNGLRAAIVPSRY